MCKLVPDNHDNEFGVGAKKQAAIGWGLFAGFVGGVVVYRYMREFCLCPPGWCVANGVCSLPVCEGQEIFLMGAADGGRFTALTTAPLAFGLTIITLAAAVVVLAAVPFAFRVRQRHCTTVMRPLLEDGGWEKPQTASQ